MMDFFNESAESTAIYSQERKIPTKQISDADTQELLKLTSSDITNSLLIKYFVTTMADPLPRFNTYDTMIVPAGRFHGSKQINTTVGRYILNIFSIPDQYHKKYGYVNDVMSKKGLKNVESKLAELILNGIMTCDEYNDFLNKTEWLSMCLTKFLTPSLSYEFLQPIDSVIKKRDELFEKHNDKIKYGDATTIESIEKTLVNDAKEHLDKSGLQSYDLYKSGVFDISVAYKKSSILGGGFKDIVTGDLKLLKSNYMDGITKDEYTYYPQYTVIGAYSRGVDTQKYGYLTKQIYGGMQNTTINQDASSDCGSEKTLDFVLNENMKSMYLYRFIVDNGKYVMLTNDNISSYTGKLIHLRSPMFCKDKKICAKCAGLLYHKTGVLNVGLVSMELSGSLLNASLKRFHDTSTHYNKVDVNKYSTKL